jgi:ATP-dependent helicase Lhr and Lhr-like helicase
LGIDIGHLDQIIQIGGLGSSSSFLQRVGRTGRRENNAQFFRGLCTDADELILLAASVNLGLRSVPESILFPGKAFHILAHQTICLSLQKQGVTTENAWNILSNASCFSGISRKEFDELIAFMILQEYLRNVGGELLVPGARSEKEFLRMNYRRLFAIFDTGPMYDVVDGKKIIGTLDSSYAMTLELPFIFVLGGHEWNAIRIDHEYQQIAVKKNDTGIAPKWKSISSSDIPFEVAQELGRIVSIPEQLRFLDSNASKILNFKRNIFSHLNWTPDKWVIDCSEDYSKMYIWTFSGDRINRTLKELVTSEMKLLCSCDFKGVIVDTPDPKSIETIIGILNDTADESPANLTNRLEDSVKVGWFSKFSDCLPEGHARKTILERVMDIGGLIRELRKVEIEVL